MGSLDMNYPSLMPRGAQVLLWVRTRSVFLASCNTAAIDGCPGPRALPCPLPSSENSGAPHEASLKPGGEFSVMSIWLLQFFFFFPPLHASSLPVSTCESLHRYCGQAFSQGERS